jgi:hypothetical protein
MQDEIRSHLYEEELLTILEEIFNCIEEKWKGYNKRHISIEYGSADIHWCWNLLVLV